MGKITFPSKGAFHVFKWQMASGTAVFHWLNSFLSNCWKFHVFFGVQRGQGGFPMAATGTGMDFKAQPNRCGCNYRKIKSAEITVPEHKSEELIWSQIHTKTQPRTPQDVGMGVRQKKSQGGC